jgi:sialate O-acetylesterase
VKVDGNTLLVTSALVASPVAVRYAWADDPVCNLVNQAALPAGPFRSDQPHYQ